jgi:uncharacterized membrane protein
MNPHLRDDILEWTASGRLKPADAPRALAIAGLTPTTSEWRAFLRALLLWTGVALIASGIIFFFAYNWNDLHRYAKFALAETLFAAALLAAWRLGVEKPSGQAALLASSVLTGAMLALVGQTYQTGADPFELFAYWALLILPWVLIARFAPLWLLWIALLNLSAVMYFQARSWGLLAVLFGPSGTLWSALTLNAAALAAWELGLARGVPWLNRWGARAIAVLTGGCATALGMMAIFEPREAGPGAALAYFAWLAATYAYYRLRVFDVFLLAGGALSAIVIVAAFLTHRFLRHIDAGAFLLIGLVVIGLSAAAAWWIRRMIQEQSA